MTRMACRWLMMIVWIVPAAAHADIPWKSETYSHFSQEEPVVDLLRQFAADQSITIVLSEKVDGTVSGNFREQPPQKFLEQITAATGLVWYFDGHGLYVYRSDEVQTKMLVLQSESPAELKRTLEGLDLIDPQSVFRVVDDRGIIYLVGTPRYIDSVSEVIEMLEAVAFTEEKTELVTEVFRLQHAWADDQVFNFNDQQVRLPGVATIVRNLQNPPQQGQGSLGGALTQNQPNVLAKLKGQGMIAPSKPAGPSNWTEVLNQANQDGRRQDQPAAGGSGPQFRPTPGIFVQPDNRLNAVIIRDTKENIAAYKELIKTLDVPTGLVQLAATIVDLDTNHSFSSGPPFDTAFRNSAGELVEIGFDLVPGDTPNLVTTVVKSGAAQFFLSLKALETAGFANIMSQPTVLTLNNVEAQLSDQQEFYVRVGGNLEVDLFNVQVGTVLKVLPHIIEDPNGQQKIKLNVMIEDGSLGQDTVDGIPVVRRSVINTQAVLNEEESLLIGGLFREEDRQTDKSVPFLGRVKFLGFFFRNVESERIRLERMVLITPRIVDLSYNANQPLPAHHPDFVPCFPEVPQPFCKVLPDYHPRVYPTPKSCLYFDCLNQQLLQDGLSPDVFTEDAPGPLFQPMGPAIMPQPLPVTPPVEAQPMLESPQDPAPADEFELPTAPLPSGRLPANTSRAIAQTRFETKEEPVAPVRQATHARVEPVAKAADPEKSANPTPEKKPFWKWSKKNNAEESGVKPASKTVIPPKAKAKRISAPPRPPRDYSQPASKSGQSEGSWFGKFWKK